MSLLLHLFEVALEESGSDPKTWNAFRKKACDAAFKNQTLPFMVVRMKRAMTALFRPHVDLATQERMVNGFNR